LGVGDPDVDFAADNVKAEKAVEDKNEDVNITATTRAVVAIIAILRSTLPRGNCIE
jgi:hypothetical protein